MDLFGGLFVDSKNKKGTQYSGEFKKYQKALKRNPNDQELRSQFIKFALMGKISLGSIPAAHLEEVLAQYEEVARTDHFDPQVYYLVGRTYQEQGSLKAQKVFLTGIQNFNRFVAKNPGVKSDHVDMAYAIALNFVTLQYGQIHPDLEKFFKIIRKSYPIHNKRVELENELRKPSPNAKRIKEIAKEIQALQEAENPGKTGAKDGDMDKEVPRLDELIMTAIKDICVKHDKGKLEGATFRYLKKHSDLERLAEYFYFEVHDLSGHSDSALKDQRVKDLSKFLTKQEGSADPLKTLLPVLEDIADAIRSARKARI